MVCTTKFQFPPDIRRHRPPGSALIHASTRFSRRILARLCGSWPPSHRDSGAGQPNSSGRWAGDGHFDMVWREAEPDSVVAWGRLQLRAGVILTNPAHRSRAAISKHHISGGWGGGCDLSAVVIFYCLRAQSGCANPNLHALKQNDQLPAGFLRPAGAGLPLSASSTMTKSG